MTLLQEYGFDVYESKLQKPEIDSNKEFGRVIAQHKGRYNVVCNAGIVSAEISGNYHFNLEEKGGYPVVGDYTYITLGSKDHAVINDILPRVSMFYRKDSWSKEGIQILASNFDTILLCTSLNRDFNITRLMRYMIMSNESNAQVGIVLTKSDLCSSDEAEAKTKLCQERFPNVPVMVVSAYTGEGLHQLQDYFVGTETVILLGSSGVGKSSLVNAISGEEIMKVGEIREYDDKGRHTTVHRQIIKLPNGGILIDTPGIREIGVVDAQEGISRVFDKISKIATNCKYTNCSHNAEDGCAIKAAIEQGDILQSEFNDYLKMLQESAFDENKEGYLFDKWQRSKKRSRDFRSARKNKNRSGKDRK